MTISEERLDELMSNCCITQRDREIRTHLYAVADGIGMKPEDVLASINRSVGNIKYFGAPTQIDNRASRKVRLRSKETS